MRGLYIHIPFCTSKCSYCDFYSLAGKTQVLSVYLDSVLLEAGKYRRMSFQTLYIGGGTPSLVGAYGLAKLINGLSGIFDLRNLKEASIEVNPESAGIDLMRSALSLGINRISIGVQSLNDVELNKSGRIHNARQALRAIDNCRICGFKNISADIIIGLPGQNWASMKRTLDQLIPAGLTHLSVYCLSIEENTPFAVNPPADLITDDQQADLFEATVDYLRQHGFLHYEISNFALPGYECLHNLNYWRGGEYVGLGPSAASHLGGRRFANLPSLDAYIADPSGIEIPGEVLKPERKAGEEAMLRLRLLEEGLNLQNMEKQYPNGEINGVKVRLDEMTASNMLVRSGCKYKLPAAKILTSNQVFVKIID